MNKERVTVSTFQKRKKDQKKITMLTAYDYPTAKILDESGVDALLVGDSLGMVVLGYEDTTKVTMDDMVHHTKAVSRGANRAMVVGDMPFLSYHLSITESIRNAGRLVQEAGAQAVKLEGGNNVVPHIKAIIEAGIPVMGHLGLTPQSINVFGGFKVQGKTVNQAQKIIDDALALEEAGVFSVVLECVPAPLVKLISEKLTIPTIGIGAGVDCDGQILVTHDMVGLYGDFTPKFVKQYCHLGSKIIGAVNEYIEEVKNGAFPQEIHGFKMNEDVLQQLREGGTSESC